MFLQKLSFLKKIEKSVDFIVVKKEHYSFSNKLQVQVHYKLNTYLLYILKKTIFMKMSEVVEIAAIDKISVKNRFCVVYLLLSEKYSIRFFVRVLNNGINMLDTITTIFKGATWLEREVYDMFGIFFKNNPDLRRILTDYGFEGYPLRKDFPVYGFVEKYFSIAENVICNNKISLLQEFRFDQRK